MAMYPYQLWSLDLRNFLQFFLFFYAWSQGDVTRLTQGYDVSGNICGKDNTPIIAVDGSVVFFRDD